ncbi:MAG: AbiH family protein [Clostridiaceae bacterium]
MQITYFIGNGFDLAMGLKTSYKDFILVYKDIPSIKNCIDYFKNKVIEPEIEYWSKMEEMIGSCTFYYSMDTLQDFCTSYDDLLSELSRYLSKQDSLFNKQNSKKTLKAFYSALFNLGELDFNPENSILAEMLSNQLMESRNYNFVSFNYTKVFDRCLHQFRKSMKLKKRIVAGKRFRDTIGPVLHIHGTLDKLMIVGVNDETQIDNKDLASKKDVRSRIIKPDIIKELSRTRTSQLNSLIDSSNVIVLFGVSIGSTDKVWWSKISDWLMSDGKHQLIVFVYLPDAYPCNPGQQIIAIKKTQDLFLRNATILPSEESAICSQIQVVINHDLFGGYKCAAKIAYN